MIERQAVTDIIELFEENKRLGCLFPQYYEYISQICISNRIPLVGEFNEKKIIEQLMQAMHINRLFSRDDMIYSCGTMMWYRPNALKPLFEIGLTMDDFPKEPIANGGTIAHAIERMPGMVCASQGYQTAIYNHTSNSMKDGNPYMPYPMKISNREYVKSLRGHKPKWYLKKTVKAIAPYGVIRIWQRIRYKF